jgi:hypothetical protein
VKPLAELERAAVVAAASLGGAGAGAALTLGVQYLLNYKPQWLALAQRLNVVSHRPEMGGQDVTCVCQFTGLVTTQNTASGSIVVWEYYVYNGTYRADANTVNVNDAELFVGLAVDQNGNVYYECGSMTACAVTITIGGKSYQMPSALVNGVWQIGVWNTGHIIIETDKNGNIVSS